MTLDLISFSSFRLLGQARQTVFSGGGVRGVGT
jgi:hypothetical protein